MEIKSIIIDAKHVGERYRCKIDDKEIYLPGKDFRYFVLLCLFRILNINDGWIDNDILDGQGTGRYIYRMKKNIQLEFPDWPVIENNNKCQYRLDMIYPDKIEIKQGVKDYPDYLVEKYYKMLRS